MSKPEQIYLYVYDLSNGMASQFGQALTGRRIDGIWHTSLVLFGIEVFYGQGISLISPPGTTHHGTPLKQLDMGTTQLDRQTFLEYIEAMKEVYQAEKYHLLDFNCNSFTNDVLGFLNGGSIPEEIRNLPRDIMATPFGQSMRPMIDQMFSGRNGPPAQTAIDSIIPSVANLPPPSTTNDDISPSSLTSNLQICTSLSAYSSLLSSPSTPAIAVMYTSPTCPPCVAIRPFFEELARQPENKAIQFVVVDVAGPGGKELAGDVRATPTFRFWCRGTMVGELKGADRAELKTRVGMLKLECWPPHPHASLSLPYLHKLTTSLTPVTYPTIPNFAALSKKLASFSSIPPTALSTINTQVIPFLTLLATSSTTKDKLAPPLPPTLPVSWVKATTESLSALSPAEWFPVLDLWRLVLPLDARLVPSIKPLLTTLLSPQTSFEDLGKPTLSTLLKLISNTLLYPILVEQVLGESEEGLTRLVVRGLLDADKGVRSIGAGLAWSVVGRVKSLGIGEGKGKGEEWDVEVASAVLEALGREEESAEVVYRLSATLGLLLYKSSHHEAIKDLLAALGVADVLDSKLTLVKGSKEQVGLLKEVKELCV